MDLVFLFPIEDYDKEFVDGLSYSQCVELYKKDENIIRRCGSIASMINDDDLDTENNWVALFRE